MPIARHDRASMAAAASESASVPGNASLPATLPERFDLVKSRVAAAARRSGRTPESIVIIAVSKYAGLNQVRELFELGQADFGENHVQSLVQRAAQLEEFMQRHRELGRASTLPRAVRWHMIGHLQRNKVRKVIGLARLIHSVDSLRLAEEIQAAAGRHDEPVEALVEVNVAGEKSKFGIAPAATRHLIDQMDTMLNIKVRGLMCMAPVAEDPRASRPVFERGRELFEEIRRSGAAGDRFDILSMGMSSDFEVAIECGANMVRIGSAIFGPPIADAEASQGENAAEPLE